MKAVNEKGVKFWLDVGSTQYALSKGLEGVQVVYAEQPNGRRSRVISKDGKPIYDDTSIEAIGVHLDIMAMSEDFRGG